MKNGGWYGESRRHSEAARGKRTPSIVGTFGSGGRGEYDLLMSQANMNEAMRFNTHLRVAKARGNQLRGGDVEKIWWLNVKGKTPSEYQKYLMSMD